MQQKLLVAHRNFAETKHELRDATFCYLQMTNQILIYWKLAICRYAVRSHNGWEKRKLAFWGCIYENFKQI